MSKYRKITLREFQNRFWTDEHCRDHLAAKRWPDGFFCPRCGHRHGYRLSNGKYRGTAKAKVFVALSLDKLGNPQFLKMGVTGNIKQVSVRRFAKRAIEPARPSAAMVIAAM